VIFVEEWDSESVYEKYLGWRKETGVLDEILAQLETARRTVPHLVR
jgi:hypothetical protein